MKLKKADYLTQDLWAFILFPCVIFAGSIILLFLNELLPAIICFSIAFIIIIFEFLARKLIFSKLIIDDEGLKTLYKNKIIKQIKWSQIKDAQVIATAQEIFIIFSSNQSFLITQKARLENWNKLFFIRISMITSIEYLCKFKDKLNISIRDIDKLPLNIQVKLK